LTQLVLIGVGLSVLILPIVYSLGVLALWAKMRSVRSRAVLVTMALLVAAIFAVNTNILSIPDLGSEGGSEYGVFEAYCKDNVAGEAYARIQNVESLQLTSGASGDTRLNSRTLGHTIMPPSVASRLALSGISRYKLFNGNGLYEFVDERGLQARRRTFPDATMQVGMEWELTDSSDRESVASLLLRVTDLQTGKTLGVQPAFVWLGESGKSVPSPTYIPGRVRDAAIATCPQPWEVIQFVKDVARPGVMERTND